MKKCILYFAVLGYFSLVVPLFSIAQHNYHHISISVSPDGRSLAAPMREEEVTKWFGAALGRLRVLTVFNELPGSTGSRSSGLIKA